MGGNQTYLTKAMSVLESSSLTEHTGLTLVSQPLVNENEDFGYKGGLCCKWNACVRSGLFFLMHSMIKKSIPDVLMQQTSKLLQLQFTVNQW